MKAGLRSGKLTKWKDDRGFGFIEPDDGSQKVFLHICEIKNSTRRPQENDTIYYHCVVDSDGKIRACNAFILGARSVSKSSSKAVNSDAKLITKPISNFPIVETVLLSILPLLGAFNFTWVTWNPVPLILYPSMSLATYSLYANDKTRAQQKAWRISEKTLHLCELAGGWLGGFIAQRTLRHKGKKASYQAEFWAIVIIHYIGWLFWLIVGRKLWV